MNNNAVETRHATSLRSFLPILRPYGTRNRNPVHCSMLIVCIISVVCSMLLRCLFDVSPMKTGFNRTIIGECTALQ